MSDSQSIRTPQESADNLADALNSFTVALNSVKRRLRWALLAVLGLALTLGLTLKFNYDDNVYRCNAGNSLRTELDGTFQRLADLLESAGTGDSPEGRELITILDQDLTRLDCEGINWLGR